MTVTFVVTYGMDETANNTKSGPVVDVHTHFFPDGLGDLAAKTGDNRWPSLQLGADGQARLMRGAEVFRPVSPTCWDPTRRLAAMDAEGTDIHVLSPVPIMLTTWAETALAADFAHRQNEAFAEAAASDPTRFRWFGTVPLQDTDAAIAELERAKQLGANGIEIGTEAGGKELDDPSLLPFFQACASLDVPIFIHPTDNVGAIRRKGQPHEFGLGMLTDTAMAAGALLFGGVLEACPGLRVGLAHGCGSFPWAFPRLARGSTLGSAPGTFSAKLSRAQELLSLMWADTLVFDPQHLGLLIARFGAEHLFLGSDFPFYPAEWGGPTEVIDAAVEGGFCTIEQGLAMRGHNGCTFLGLDVDAAIGHPAC